MGLRRLAVWSLWINKKIRELRFNFSTLLFLFLFFQVHSGFSQNKNTIWCFGDSAGINFNDPLNPLPISTSLDTRGSCVSIADSTGNLLFYADTRSNIVVYTTQIWNAANDLIENGDSIIGGNWYNDLIIIPKPDMPTQYYLFCMGSSALDGLYYSVVDMSENGGLGKVIQKNMVLHSYQGWDGFTAVKHANGRDWWLISKDRRTGTQPSGDNFFTIYLISPAGIIETRQAIGSFVYGGAGTMVFTKSGNKLLFSTWRGLIELLDFDRCTGVFSNPVIVSGVRLVGSAVTASSAFSPNEEVIYVCQNDTTCYLFQYDLTAPNIAASKETLTVVNSPYYYSGMLRLAPDDKIYWSGFWQNGIIYTYPYADTMYNQQNMNLSVINDPNVIGSGCNLSMNSFFLNSKRTYYGLPNNPDYELGAEVGSICDSLSNGLDHLTPLEDFIIVYPNPFTNELNLLSKYPIRTKLILRNALGQEIFRKTIGEKESINLSSLSDGIYFLELISEKGIQRMKLMKVK